MKVIGLTTSLRGEADRKCRSGFSAWLAEVRHGTWANWTELLGRYPKAHRIGDGEAHFPLTADGTGIRTMVFFKLGRMRLLSIVPAPVASAKRTRRNVLLSHSYSQPESNDTNPKL
jgi:hypothetical protein